MAIEHAINEQAFIDLVLHDDLRRELLSFVGTSDARSELVSVVASKCHATADELRRAVQILGEDSSFAASSILSDLLFHPDVPEDCLLALAQKGTCIAALGHRARTPRSVLEILASVHRYPEAITTLAIHHYGLPTAKLKPFHEFISRYADVPMLEYNLRRATLDDAKRRAFLEVFGEER